MERYRCSSWEKIGEGAYGTVFKAKDSKTGKWVAVKKIIIKNEGIPSSALREISALKELSHPNVVRSSRYYFLHSRVSSFYRLESILYEDDLFLVFELLDCDLKIYLEKHILDPFGVKVCLVFAYCAPVLLGVVLAVSVAGGSCALPPL